MLISRWVLLACILLTPQTQVPVAARYPHILQPRFLMGCGPPFRERPFFFSVGTLFFLTSIVPPVSSKCSSTWSTLASLFTSCLNRTNPKVVSVGMLMFSSAPWFPLCHLVLPTRSSLSSTSTSIQHILDTGPTVDVGVLGRMWNIMCDFLQGLSPKSDLVSPSQVLGKTLALRRAESFLLFFSTFLSTASSRLRVESLLVFNFPRHL